MMCGLWVYSGFFHIFFTVKDDGGVYFHPFFWPGFFPGLYAPCIPRPML